MAGKLMAGVLGAVACLQGVAVSSATTLEEVKARGALRCGVSQGLPGFSNQDKDGKWSGLDVDFCRAVAAAVLGNASAVELTPLSATERFDALRAKSIDVLTRNTSWTMTFDTTLGLNFAVVNYFDGQGFLVRRNMNISSALELSGATICATAGTTTVLNVIDYFTANNMEYDLLTFENSDEALVSYDSGPCQAYTTDQAGLYAQRLKLKEPTEHMVLPEVISKEPLGPVVREGDDQWLDIVKWVHFAMINAEEMGVASGNVDEMRKSNVPGIRRLLGIDGGFGASLGLTEDWAYNLIKQVGNYGEVFNRNVGPDTPLAIARGVNALWAKGGLQYAPPIR